MAHITIQNIGPIKNVSFDLNKVNVFMGPQSSGKSTIAKIISYCSWFEKDTIIHVSNHPDFWNELIAFHNLEKSYFSDESRIVYKSNFCSFDMKWKNRGSKGEVQYTRKNFRNRKIAYIPAERNFVTIPGLGRYNESRDNVLSFLYDWFLAKKEFNETSAFDLPIHSLGDVSFFYDKEIDSDKVRVQDDKIIGLNHASSGLRSCIPLLVVFNHMMEAIYNRLRPQTPLEVMNFYERLRDIQNVKEEGNAKRKNAAMSSYKSLSEMYEDFGKKTLQASEYDNRMSRLFYQKLQAQWADLVGFYGDYFHTLAIIEEPELNLFPKTQQDVVYYMLGALAQSEREHQLVLTTHSPFILFAINNCMMGGLVGKQIPKTQRRRVPSRNAWMSPSDVSVYEIHKGEIVSIQDKDGIIEDNYLNQAYKENINEYLSMLNYFENEE